MTDGVDVWRPPDPDQTDEDDGDVEPVELLVQLAEEGEIDPWDVDIVTVTDEFLAALDDGDLRTSGRALFYASVLLRMKSDALLADDTEDEEADPLDQAPPWEADWTEDVADAPEVDPIDALESEMERRLERKTARGTPMTLDELVRDLRAAERGTWWKESRTYDTSESPSGFDRGVQDLDYRTDDDSRLEGEPSAEDVTGTTHQENIDELIEAVWNRLVTAYDRGRAEVLFAEIAGAAGSRVESFLALLFLSHRGDVVLEQDELFGDLWIVDPDATESAPTDDGDGGVDGDGRDDGVLPGEDDADAGSAAEDPDAQR